MDSLISTEIRQRGAQAAGLSTGALLVMWAAEGLDSITGHALDPLGITSWNFGDLWSLVTAPFIHFGFTHLMANSLPFWILGLVIALISIRRWFSVTAITALTSGLAAFFINGPHTNTAGASGVVFGYITYLVSRGIITRRWTHLILGLVVLAAYGSVLWGVLPTQPGVSWQGHLGGALGGILAAYLLDRKARAH